MEAVQKLMSLDPNNIVKYMDRENLIVRERVADFGSGMHKHQKKWLEIDLR